MGLAPAKMGTPSAAGGLAFSDAKPKAPCGADYTERVSAVPEQFPSGVCLRILDLNVSGPLGPSCQDVPVNDATLLRFHAFGLP